MALTAEVGEWKQKVQQLEERLEKMTAERDKLKSKMYDSERVNAQYVMQFTQEDKDKAAKAIDTLLDELTIIETRLTLTNEK